MLLFPDEFNDSKLFDRSFMFICINTRPWYLRYIFKTFLLTRFLVCPFGTNISIDFKTQHSDALETLHFQHSSELDVNAFKKKKNRKKLKNFPNTWDLLI